jgi:esterase/lipase
VSARLHKTIDENLIVNRILSNSKSNFFKRDPANEENLEDRMRIFEDEIIKRIKIIQNFVKNMDGKINRIKASQKQNAV